MGVPNHSPTSQSKSRCVCVWQLIKTVYLSYISGCTQWVSLYPWSETQRPRTIHQTALSCGTNAGSKATLTRVSRRYFELIRFGEWEPRLAGALFTTGADYRMPRYSGGREPAQNTAGV
eukprot:5415153-Pyramimonas_sp.AAC.1